MFSSELPSGFKVLAFSSLASFLSQFDPDAGPGSILLAEGRADRYNARSSHPMKSSEETR